LEQLPFPASVRQMRKVVRTLKERAQKVQGAFSGNCDSPTPGLHTRDTVPLGFFLRLQDRPASGLSLAKGLDCFSASFEPLQPLQPLAHWTDQRGAMAIAEQKKPAPRRQTP